MKRRSEEFARLVPMVDLIRRQKALPQPATDERVRVAFDQLHVAVQNDLKNRRGLIRVV